jgi:hypothetical protein
MAEQKAGIVILISHRESVLSAHQSEAFAQFQDKAPHMGQELPLHFAFLRISGSIFQAR